MTVRWSVPLGESGVVTEALHHIMVEAREHPGCLSCTLRIEAGRWVGIRYDEEWAGEDWLQREVRSERFTSLASLIESATEPPLVEFTLPEGTLGLEYVERVRALGARW
jgi:hypothetical protein